MLPFTQLRTLIIFAVVIIILPFSANDSANQLIIISILSGGHLPHHNHLVHLLLRVQPGRPNLGLLPCTQHLDRRLLILALLILRIILLSLLESLFLGVGAVETVLDLCQARLVLLLFPLVDHIQRIG